MNLTANTRDDLIGQIRSRREETPGGLVLLHKALRFCDCGSHVWTIERTTFIGTAIKTQIVHWKIANDDGVWTASPTREAAFPPASDCPPEWFRQVPAENWQWRNETWEYAEEVLGDELRDKP